MELARAFTKRVKRPDHGLNHATSIRNHISGPVALISTTNMLSYNAPDINRSSDSPNLPTPSTPTRSSIELESDDSAPSPTSTAATSILSSPAAEDAPISEFFPKLQPHCAAQPDDVEEAPVLPTRASTHSKREHERLSRQRSFRFSRSSSAMSTRESPISDKSLDASAITTVVSRDCLAPSPFSRELEQLNEVAEEFTAAARSASLEEDMAVMQARGLCKFNALDYLAEIEILRDLAGAPVELCRSRPWI